MEEVSLNAQIREETGKQSVKHIRREGLIPAVVYKRGQKNLLLRLDRKELLKILHTSLGENVVISLKIGADSKDTSGRKNYHGTKTVIIKELQEEPIKHEILHVDFQEVSLTESIKVNVPISVSGEAVGVKRDGGLLEHLLWEIEVECLPSNIPEQIEVDISQLEIGQSVHVKDLRVPSEVKVLNESEQIVLTVASPVEEKVEEKPEEELPEEPEVIKQKKPEPEEKAASDKEKKQGEKKQEEKK